MSDRDQDESYRQMVNTNLGRLTAIAKSYAERESHEDLLQEILYQLWRSFPSFNGRSKLDTWVYKGALNTAITGLRRAQSRPRLVTNADESVAEPISGDEIPSDVADVFETFLRDLNKVDRAILILYLDDRSYQEIADITGHNSNAVGVRLNRIKARFRQQHVEA